MADKEIFRPRSAIGMSIGVGVIAALSIGSLVASGQWDLLPGSVCLTVAGAGLLWTLMIRPKVEVSIDGVTIVNPLRTIEIPWDAVEVVDNKYSLNITTANGKFNAWAAVAPSRYQARRVHSTDIKHTSLDGRAAIRAADSPNSETGTAMLLIEHFMRLAETSGTASKSGGVKVSLSKTAIGLLAAATASVLLGVFFHWI